MRINWIGYYHDHDGYGRFNSRMVKALREAGADIHFLTRDHITMPRWMQKIEGIEWDGLTISCMPAINAYEVPGRHWLLTMIESNVLDHDWLVTMAKIPLEKVLVPCEENKTVFESAGLPHPVEVFRGGTDPDEFPVTPRELTPKRPYTFFAMADRGMRKGWEEVWRAFYVAFGGKTTGNMDVRLIIKCLPFAALADTIGMMSNAEGADKRITYIREKFENSYHMYDMADCIVLPSHFEGWGMPHREAAMMGLPVITVKYSGMDDGYTDKWALTVPHEIHELGWWAQADVGALAQTMEWAYHNPQTALDFGRKASAWLRENQTWKHSAENLLRMIEGDTWHGHGMFHQENILSIASETSTPESFLLSSPARLKILLGT